MATFIFGFWLLCAAGLVSGVSGLLGIPALGWVALFLGLVALFEIGRGFYQMTVGRE